VETHREQSKSKAAIQIKITCLRGTNLNLGRPKSILKRDSNDETLEGSISVNLKLRTIRIPNRRTRPGFVTGAPPRANVCSKPHSKMQNATKSWIKSTASSNSTTPSSSHSATVVSNLPLILNEVANPNQSSWSPLTARVWKPRDFQPWLNNPLSR